MKKESLKANQLKYKNLIIAVSVLIPILRQSYEDHIELLDNMEALPSTLKQERVRPEKSALLEKVGLLRRRSAV